MKKRYALAVAGLAALLCAQPAMAVQNCYWGYSNSKVAAEFGSQTSAKAAIYVPAEVAQLYKGCTISAIKVGLAAKSNVTVFITKDLNGDPLAKKTAGALYKGWNEVKLSSSYTIDGEPFYIGYSYEGENNSLGVSSMYSENGCWADLGDGWKNYATERGVNGQAIALQAKISGDTLPKDFWIYGNRNIIVEKDKDFSLSFGIKNMCPFVGREFKVGYSIDGGEETVGTFSTVMGSNVEKEFSFDCGAYSETGTHEVKLRLLSVDGSSDDYAGNDEAVLKLNVVNSIPRQRMVVEEGTGTWCGYCPIGIIGLENMYEKYPETFIGIAVHKDDGSLTTASYNSLTYSGYPNCYVNRDLNYPMKPAFETLEAVHNQLVTATPVMDVAVAADFVDGDKKQISAKAMTTFLAEHSGMNYRVSFVLTEDKVKGYEQRNYYSGSSSMGIFGTGGSYVSVDMDHVARMNYGYSGVKGSIPANVDEGETTTYEAVLDVPYVQSYDNLNLIALIIDASTGLIENAAEVKVGSGTTSVADLKDRVAPDFSFDGDRLNTNGFDGDVRIYNAEGVEVANSGLAPGLYIVKATYSGKSVVRKMVKR